MGKFVQEPARKPGVPKALWVVLILLLALAFGALAAVKLLFVEAGGNLIWRYASEADLRGSRITVEEYDALAAQMPDCRILWDVPLGSTRYSSTDTTVTVEDASEQTLKALSYFENLQTVDARAVTSADDLEALRRTVPGCTVLWSVYLEGSAYDPGETVLDLSQVSLAAEELMAFLSRFDSLEQVTLPDMGPGRETAEELARNFPDTVFLWSVELLGKTWLNTDTSLSWAGEPVDAAALTAGADAFLRVEQIDLTGCGLTMEELAAVKEAYGGAFVLAEITLFDQTFSTDATYLDFSNIPMDSTELVAAMAELMPYLEKVDMCGCGISNEDMDALNKQFENTMFVWEVHFSVYTLRTDATYFCAADLPWNGNVGIKMTDAQLEPIKYCTELIALDLGHMKYTDLSFLYNMPKLQYLILVEAKFSDITPIGSLKELIYLELFVNTFDDLSPLLECTELRHLNLGYTSGFDASVLKQMTWLERLWYPGHHQDVALVEEIIAALPDTEVYAPQGDSDGSTGHGWREHEIYYKMRDILHMYYMPGGTGTDTLKG